MSSLNDPRVLLALERTLLAWNRSGLGLIAFGFLIERSTLMVKIFQQEVEHSNIFISKLVGVIVILFGMLIGFWSARQYKVALKSLTEDELIEGYRTDLPIYLGMFNILCGFLLILVFVI